MNFIRKPIGLAVLLGLTQIAGMTYAQGQKVPATPSTEVAAATKQPIQTRVPENWIIYDDTTYTPVVDEVSRHLDAARKAFDAKDNKKAASEMRAVVDELKRQAARASKENMLLIDDDKALLAADTKFAKESIKHMNASAQKVSSAVESIENGKIKTNADLDKVINSAARADLDRRWVITDVATWYPVVEEPQRHFTDAVADYAKKDYKAAATDIRKATSYLRLEAGRAVGNSKQALDHSVSRLDTLAASVEKGALKDEQSMAKTFAEADHALALAHRAKAAESWAHKAYDNTGYELKAAAHGLESAAGWAGGEAKAAAESTVKDTRALGDKLASGAHWTREEVAKGFESLSSGINALGQRIGDVKKAAPGKTGS